jgi:hypothetical protein
MCTISFDKEALNITIHNQHPNLELTSPIYCNNGTVCLTSPSQQIDAGSATKASFGIVPKQRGSKGALLYKLQRRHANETRDQPNRSIAYIEDTAENIHFWRLGI